MAERAQVNMMFAVALLSLGQLCAALPGGIHGHHLCQGVSRYRGPLRILVAQDGLCRLQDLRQDDFVWTP